MCRHFVLSASSFLVPSSSSFSPSMNSWWWPRFKKLHRQRKRTVLRRNLFARSHFFSYFFSVDFDCAIFLFLHLHVTGMPWQCIFDVLFAAHYSTYCLDRNTIIMAYCHLVTQKNILGFRGSRWSHSIHGVPRSMRNTFILWCFGWFVCNMPARHQPTLFNRRQAKRPNLLPFKIFFMSSYVCVLCIIRVAVAFKLFSIHFEISIPLALGESKFLAKLQIDWTTPNTVSKLLTGVETRQTPPFRLEISKETTEIWMVRPP